MNTIKKIMYIILFFVFSLTISQAAEKKDCSKYKYGSDRWLCKTFQSGVSFGSGEKKDKTEKDGKKSGILNSLKTGWFWQK